MIGLLRVLFGLCFMGIFFAIGVVAAITLKVLSILFLCTVVYFFLAAVGLVPPVDFIPIVPYV